MTTRLKATMTQTGIKYVGGIDPSEKDDKTTATIFGVPISNGGPGSGNFGHSGRPGEQGGSGGGGEGGKGKGKGADKLKDLVGVEHKEAKDALKTYESLGKVAIEAKKSGDTKTKERAMKEMEKIKRTWKMGPEYFVPLTRLKTI